MLGFVRKPAREQVASSFAVLFSALVRMSHDDNGIGSKRTIFIHIIPLCTFRCNLCQVKLCDVSFFLESLLYLNHYANQRSSRDKHYTYITDTVDNMLGRQPASSHDNPHPLLVKRVIQIVGRALVVFVVSHHTPLE